jgi:hypothetical protein
MTRKDETPAPDAPAVEASAIAEPRRVPAGTVIQYADGEGNIRRIEAETLADDDGYAFVAPRDAGDVAALDSLAGQLGDTVARKALAEGAVTVEPAEAGATEEVSS